MSQPTVQRLLAPAVLLVVLLGLHSTAFAQLTATQIAERMEAMNQQRATRLAHSVSQRHYHVEYNGIAHLSADMSVEVTVDARSGKSLRIVSESGSHMLCEKVLRRAVESEREAAHDRNATALTTANYRFSLQGAEPVNGRSAYILNVEPITTSKFLYRGRIWVDAAEFAVVKIAVSPAKNPSFWISRTLIEQSFQQVGEFWMPATNRSETHVRVGGTALFTIDCGNYQLQPATIMASNSTMH
jgi:outer membrane lipoprotein-sorting protein